MTPQPKATGQRLEETGEQLNKAGCALLKAGCGMTVLVPLLILLALAFLALIL